MTNTNTESFFYDEPYDMPSGKPYDEHMCAGCIDQDNYNDCLLWEGK